MKNPVLATLLLTLTAASCQQLQKDLDLAPRPPEDVGLWPEADHGVAHPGLAALCRDAWEDLLANDPLWASQLADPRSYGRLPNNNIHHRRERDDELAEFIERLENLDSTNLGASDRITYELLLERFRMERTLHSMDLESWNLNSRSGPQNEFLSMAVDQPVQSARQRAQMVERWQAMDTYVKNAAHNLLRGLREGRVASRTQIQKTIAQVDRLLATHPMDSPLLQPAMGGGRWVPLSPDGTVASIAYEELGDSMRQTELRAANPHLQEGRYHAEGTRVLIPSEEDPLTAEERGRFLFAVLKAVEDEVYPAFEYYRETLKERILPKARPDSQPGIGHLAQGSEHYQNLIRYHTSLDLTPEEIHAYGREEVARIRSEIAVLGERVFGTSDVAKIQRKLREDPEMHFSTRGEVQAKAEEALFRANRVVREWFGILPSAECEVVRVPAHEEKDTTIAYYREPAPDGSRPGRYYVNTYAPETRPRYEAEVLAFHEAVPGHHLQIAIAQELADLPLVRRNSHQTVYVEGWALYTERLCNEMGLYSGDVDRLGMLSFDAWRACRLVVDTGVHAMGWSRDEAIDYLFENTLLARNNVVNEVDRYIAWPGQALAYKIGQREILALRERAQETLGGAFSYSEFHDRVLQNGPVTLSVLRAEFDRWLARAR